MAVSIVILTFNEQDNIAHCLKGLEWCDDVWVVDSFSTDQTLAVAQAAGAHVVEKEWLGFAEARNHALDTLPLKYDWVLHLDADEYVTQAFANEIRTLAREKKADDDIVAFEVPSRLFFMGRWLRHGGTYPNYQVRFGRKDALRFVQAGHGQREQLAFGRLARMDACLYHFNFSKGTDSWLRKHLVYARDEAEQSLIGVKESVAFARGLSRATSLRRDLKYISKKMPARPLLRFIYMYFLRLGFMDGAAGFHYCLLASIYEYFTALHSREMKRGYDAFDETKVPR